MKKMKIAVAILVGLQWFLAVKMHKEIYPLTPIVSPRFTYPLDSYTTFTTKTETYETGKPHHSHFELKKRCAAGDTTVFWRTTWIRSKRDSSGMGLPAQ